MTQPAKKPAANVVSLRPVETTEDIVNDVQDRAARDSREISDTLKELVVLLNALHRKRAEVLFSIGAAMDRPRLDNLIEIGQRMLAQTGRRA